MHFFRSTLPISFSQLQLISVISEQWSMKLITSFLMQLFLSCILQRPDEGTWKAKVSVLASRDKGFQDCLEVASLVYQYSVPQDKLVLQMYTKKWHIPYSALFYCEILFFFFLKTISFCLRLLKLLNTSVALFFPLSRLSSQALFIYNLSLFRVTSFVS